MAKKKETPVVAPTPAPARPKATPARRDGKIGPDPVALKEGRFNPEREGLVLKAIRAGLSTVSEIVAETKLRVPTVRYGGLGFAEAGVTDAIRVGPEYYFVVREDDRDATAKAKETRKAVVARRDAATAPAKAEVAETPKAAKAGKAKATAK